MVLRRQEKTLAAIDDLLAAVAADQAATDSATTLLDSIQQQLVDLQAQLQALLDNPAPDLQPVIDQVNTITAQLTASEAPPA